MPAVSSHVLFVFTSVPSSCLGAVHALCNLLQASVPPPSQGPSVLLLAHPVFVAYLRLQYENYALHWRLQWEYEHQLEQQVVSLGCIHTKLWWCEMMWLTVVCLSVCLSDRSVSHLRSGASCWVSLLTFISSNISTLNTFSLAFATIMRFTLSQQRPRSTQFDSVHLQCYCCCSLLLNWSSLHSSRLGLIPPSETCEDGRSVAIIVQLLKAKFHYAS